MNGRFFYLMISWINYFDFFDKSVNTDRSCHFHNNNFHSSRHKEFVCNAEFSDTFSSLWKEVKLYAYCTQMTVIDFTMEK